MSDGAPTDVAPDHDHHEGEGAGTGRTGDEAPRGEVARDEGGAGRRGWLVLAVGTLAVIAVRLWASRHAEVPQLVADEAAYLSMGRYLGGGPVWNLGRAATYGPGYSVLLAPFFWAGLSPDGIYRAAIVCNALLGGATLVAVEALVRRLTTLVRPVSVIVAALAVSIPALTVTANHAWSDSLTPLAFVLLVLACLRLVERPTLGTGLLVAAAQAFAYAAHGRFAPLAVVVLALLVVLGLRRRLVPRVVAASMAAVAGAMYVVYALSEVLYDRIYEPGGAVVQTTWQLGRALRVVPVSITASGQLWYLLVTTAGLAGFGILALIRAGWGEAEPLRSRVRARFGEHDRTVERPDPTTWGLRSPGPTALAVIGSLVVLSFAVSAGFMADRDRPDQLVYGRYNDAFVAPLVALGLAVLLTAPGWRRRLVDGATVVVVAVVAGAYVRLTRLELLQERFSSSTILGLLALEPRGTQRLGFATVVGVGLVAVVVLTGAVRNHRKVVLLATVAVLVAVGVQRSAAPYGEPQSPDPRGAAVLDDVLGPDDLVVTPFDDAIPARDFYRYPFYAEDLRTVTVFRAPWEAGDPLVLTAALATEYAPAGYRLAWVDPASTTGLWVGPGADQRRLAEAGLLLPEGPLGASSDRDPAASVTIVGGVGFDDGRLRTVVEVDRALGEPWAVAGRGGSPVGRVRLGIAVVDPACACTVTEGRQDLGEWVDGDAASLRLEVDAALDDLGPGRYEVRVQLLREGAERFGDEAVVALTVEP